ncbi:hypothetical protein WR25_02504 [Diploscapter pachys]|uniref:HMA domain-containing protein n=1 Tax=Diploscapter pachys TaxID=2018661 RepID=A0A2A2K2F1_9BILA|nr:hypothetical protein WR25_02504 [Diploscapter pachys]
MFGTDGVPALSKAALEAAERLRQSGRTTMVVRRADKDLGAIGLLDTPREGAKEALQKLREMGIGRMVMISGDHNRVAEAVARQVGLDEAWGDLMPEDKVKAIKNLRLSSSVAMVGDGVNDAPAMANSSVGIAMGAAGSDTGRLGAGAWLNLLHIPASPLLASDLLILSAPAFTLLRRVRKLKVSMTGEQLS